MKLQTHTNAGVLITLRAHCPDCTTTQLTMYDTGDGECVCESCREVFPQSIVRRNQTVAV